MGEAVWTSKLAFIFASVGAAVGFGNVWRFPALAYEYGGGAFFIPYLLALIFIGIPLCILEIGLGQYHQTGDVGVFGAINPRLRGIGLISIICGYLIVTFYVPLIGWVVRAFFESFSDPDAWDGITGSQGWEYFTNNIMGMSTLGPDLRPTRLVGPNVGYLFLSWFIIFLCVAFDVSTTGRITYFTMGLPVVTLFIFLVRACTLEGARDGIKAYIGVWDMSVLSERPEVWSLAVSQIFFSVGVTFGILTAYGAHCPRKWPAYHNSLLICIANSMYSFIAGFAVFAGLGYASRIEETPIDQLRFGGPALLFGTYPTVLATLPGGVHWIRLLFLTLFLLGIDSAFALVEAVLTVMKNSTFAVNTPRIMIVGGTCIFGFACGILYCTDAGLIFLDVVDFYVNFLMLLVGFFEAVACGWIYGLEDQMKKLGPAPLASYFFTTFGSIIVACAVWFGVKSDNAVWAGFVTLFVLYLVGMLVTCFLLMKVKSSQPEMGWTLPKLLYELMFQNVMDHRNDLAAVIGRIPAIWAILVKHVLPPILFVCFVNLANAKNDTGEPTFGHYESFVFLPFQLLGILIIAFVVLIALVGAFIPHLYSCLELPQEEEDDVKGSKKEEADEFVDEQAEQPKPTAEEEMEVEVEA